MADHFSINLIRMQGDVGNFWSPVIRKKQNNVKDR